VLKYIYIGCSRIYGKKQFFVMFPRFACCPSGKNITQLSRKLRLSDTDGGRMKCLKRKPVSLTLYPPQIPHEVTWNQSRVSEVKGR
jgi:hypothetical protein